MSFFLPGRLIEFEYLEPSVLDEEVREMAYPYQDDMDFAFYAVHFHYSREDYEALTPRQKIFIMKEWENYLVSSTTHIRNAVQNGFYNVNRPKNKRYLPLWKKRIQKIENKEELKHMANAIQKSEKIKGTAWVDIVYKANGMKRRYQ